MFIAELENGDLTAFHKFQSLDLKIIKGIVVNMDDETKSLLQQAKTQEEINKILSKYKEEMDWIYK